jgi:hypothetical protein
MGSLAYLAIIVFIQGVIQIIYPELFIRLKIQGTKSPHAIRIGGYIVIPVSIVLFVIDLLK